MATFEVQFDTYGTKSLTVSADCCKKDTDSDDYQFLNRLGQVVAQVPSRNVLSIVMTES